MHPGRYRVNSRKTAIDSEYYASKPVNLSLLAGGGEDLGAGQDVGVERVVALSSVKSLHSRASATHVGVSDTGTKAIVSATSNHNRCHQAHLEHAQSACKLGRIEHSLQPPCRWTIYGGISVIDSERGDARVARLQAAKLARLAVLLCTSSFLHVPSKVQMS